ncbi:uncharacterized protein UMAG_11530 [Mycosarcoma maydis]|uniref:Uncharacterized protein n=1 Tax=Mycosarcoma maydis TaxID=5270 RepID=A0A0D1CN33_MYCMD|nr:uncharacterized protein UMAG_11530 [Ustilago maydis 521]KIS68048.1 hypothetical protein UMAG_11530 [Ustilago maydis 521]|eukprot:XP_011390570.1 hypothetical protein UMAG_11530 [Ustilago maydis 521]
MTAIKALPSRIYSHPAIAIGGKPVIKASIAATGSTPAAHDDANLKCRCATPRHLAGCWCFFYCWVPFTISPSRNSSIIASTLSVKPISMLLPKRFATRHSISCIWTRDSKHPR